MSPGRRERTKAANRAAILAAAQRVFAEQGYGAASVRDIIRRTDLASGTFYNYFPDKDAIFVALIAEAGEEARRRVRAARRSASTAEDFVRGGYRAFFEFIVEEPERFAFMRRNLDTMTSRFGDTVLPAAPRSWPRTCARRSRPGTCRRSTSSTARTRWSRSGWSWERGWPSAPRPTSRGRPSSRRRCSWARSSATR